MTVAAISSIAPPSNLSWVRSLGPFVVMCVGMFIALLDIQIVASSLQDIGGGLSAAQDQISWVQTAYLIAEIIMIPLSGWLTRVFSTRWLFTASAAGFTVASMLCGLAWNIESMIVFRALQGLLGASMIPIVFDSAGGPSLALHLLHLGNVPPDVLETFGRPLVGQFSHGRRRSDGEDRAHLIDEIGDMRDGGIAVHRRPRAHHLLSFRIPTGKPARVASRRLGDHFHRVAGTLLNAHRAARAERVSDLVAAAGPELEDGVLRTGGEAIIAFETIAA